MRVADVIARRLYEAGCRHAFGMPGGEVLTLVDALEQAGIRFHLARHENAAGFMAEGVWHRTGAPGILVATVGPGVLNTVNVAANAAQDRVPLIVLAGAVDPDEAVTYSHQVLDQVAVFRPVCKMAFSLQPAAAGASIDKALAVALDGRPGPVMIDVPVRVAAAPGEPYGYRRAASVPAVPAEGPELGTARRWLAEAERPLALIGHDAVLHRAGPAVQAFLERFGIPALTTYKAKGLLPEDHPLCVGPVALSPKADRITAPLVSQADLILLLGYDPIEMRIGWKDRWDPREVNVLEIAAAPNDQYLHHAGIAFVADVGETVRLLGQGVEPRALWPQGEPAAVRVALREAFALGQEPWGPLAICGEVRAALPREALVTADAGAHRILVSQAFPVFGPDLMLQSMGLCTMACAVPLAAGARLADPERPAVAFVGDGGLMMALGELATLADLKIPLVIVVFVDESLTLIEMKQRGMQLGNAGVDFAGGYDYPAIARAMGGLGFSVASREALKAALGEALAADRFSLIACRIDRRAYDGLI